MKLGKLVCLCNFLTFCCRKPSSWITNYWFKVIILIL
jgi:hypothetical protein